MDGATQRSARAAGMADEESASQMTQDDPITTAGAWKTDRVGIRRADNGGFIVDCSRTRKMPPGKGNGGGNAPSPVQGGSDYENKDYAFSSIGEVQGFLAQEFGGAAAGAPADEGDDHEDL